MASTIRWSLAGQPSLLCAYVQGTWCNFVHAFDICVVFCTATEA